MQLPDGVAFVTPEWVSSCLAQGKRLPEAAHLIDLARMLLLANLQVGLRLITTATQMKNAQSACTAQLHSKGAAALAHVVAVEDAHLIDLARTLLLARLQREYLQTVCQVGMHR